MVEQAAVEQVVVRGRSTKRAQYRLRAIALIAVFFGLSFVGIPQATAQAEVAELNGSVVIAPDQPLGGVKIDLFAAADPWNRAEYIAPAFTDTSGEFSFTVEPDTCYIVVAISALGYYFESPDSGQVYDQRYVCVGTTPTSPYLAVLYGEDTPVEEEAELPGLVVFDNEEPAAGAPVTLFEAVSPWDRGTYLGSAVSTADGEYSFSVLLGCYIVVVVAPLGSSFESVGSGDVYDQLYACVEFDGSGGLLESVLYREELVPE